MGDAASGECPSALATQEALQFGGQFVARRQVAECRRQAFLVVLLRFQLAHQSGVLVALGDQLLDLLMSGSRRGVQRGGVDLELGHAGEPVEQRRGRGRIGHGGRVVGDSGPQTHCGDLGLPEGEFQGPLDPGRHVDAGRQETDPGGQFGLRRSADQADGTGVRYGRGKGAEADHQLHLELRRQPDDLRQEGMPAHVGFWPGEHQDATARAVGRDQQTDGGPAQLGVDPVDDPERRTPSLGSR